eukprot:TRINITY_DN92472_c0_g1_i1.p1 TRINITY_DN92472_c0_g1~~TRINITY_DN92472_c0_g1_i1.p1  ORF type:complete len:307 (+),score=37.84 TRINITY_DN92472_c0_g1_i1:68-988(+)
MIPQELAMDYTQGQETWHQTMQRSLSERDRGGPHEQMRSKPARLRSTRSCDILHSSLEEPLAGYKTLEPLRPRWPSTFRRLHLNDGIRVRDCDTVVVSARDQLGKTKKGLVRSSSGTVTYSNTHRMKVELDVHTLAEILGDGVPGGRHAWTPSRLEFEFVHRTGRPGAWNHYDVGIIPFMLLFPKTFDLFGPSHDYVRLTRKISTTVLDNIEDALVRLARSREDGSVQHTLTEAQFSETSKWAEQHLEKAGFMKSGPKAKLYPDLKSHRLKATYRGKGDVTSSTWRSSRAPQETTMSGFGRFTFAE